MDETRGKSDVEGVGASAEVLTQALELALKIPGVRVDRVAFLREAFPSMTARQIDEGVPADCFDIDILDKAARDVVSKGTLETTLASIALAAPSVVPAAGTAAKLALIAPDLAQNLGVCINLAQKISYIYGVREFDVKSEEQVDKLMLLAALATMFGGAAAAPVLRNLGLLYGKKLSTAVSKTAVTKLMPTAWRWLITPLAKAIAPKAAPKATVVQAAKFIPFGIGVGIAGVVTWFTTSQAGKRLIEEMRKPLVDPDVFERDQEEIEILIAES